MRTLLVSLLVGAAAACGEIDAPRGVLVTVYPGAFESTLNRPARATFGTVAANAVTDPLIRHPVGGAATPGLAAWSRSDDGRAWMVRLRDGARFASGRPITAADVVASLRAAGLGGALAGVEAIDDRTVRVLVPSPRHDIGSTLGRAPILRADQAARSDPLPLAEIDASGSWRVARVREPDVVLAPNPHALDPPELEGIVLRAAGTPRNAIAAAVAGEVDAFSGGAFTGREEELLDDHTALEVTALAPRRIVSLRHNCRSPRTRDAAVRRALALAVDRDAIAARYGTRHARSIATLHRRPSRHDPVAAEALLDAAGWRRGADGVRERDGLRLDLAVMVADYFAEVLDTVQMVGADLRAIGVETRIEVVSATEVPARRVRGDYDLNFTWIIDDPTTPTPQSFAYHRPQGPPDGIAGGSWDFGGCGGSMAPWVALYDRATTAAEVAAARDGLIAATVIDPPALLVYEMAYLRILHHRFEVRAPPSGRESSYWPGVVLRPGEALSRDRLAHWLDGP